MRARSLLFSVHFNSVFTIRSDKSHREAVRSEKAVNPYRIFRQPPDNCQQGTQNDYIATYSSSISYFLFPPYDQYTEQRQQNKKAYYASRRQCLNKYIMRVNDI